MKTRLSFLILVFEILNCLVCYGAESPIVRLPASVTPVSPIAVTELLADAIFVIECDTPCMVLASREGYVTIEVHPKPDEQPGPLRIRGRFADGNKVESRTYKAKQLWIIEAATPGEVEILIVPEGVKDATKVIRRTLVVGGVTPKPPPKPTDPILPKPKPNEPPPEPQPVPLGLGEIIKNSVKLNVPAHERPIALKIADAYKEGAKNLANGTWTIDKAIANQRDLNTKIPGYKADVWRPVFKDVADALAEARDNDKFSTQKQYVAVWAELSLAFFGANE